MENYITQERIKDTQIFEGIKYDTSHHMPPANKNQQNVNEFQLFHSKLANGFYKFTLQADKVHLAWKEVLVRFYTATLQKFVISKQFAAKKFQCPAPDKALLSGFQLRRCG